VNKPPRVMPCCDNTLCHRCIGLIGVRSNRYNCISCNEEKEMPAKNFPFNRQISLELLFSEEAKSKKETTNLLNELRNEFQRMKSRFENDLAERQKKIDLDIKKIKASNQTEKCIEKIQEQFNKKIWENKEKLFKRYHYLNDDKNIENFLQDPQLFSHKFDIDGRITNRIYLLQIIEKLKLKFRQELVQMNKYDDILNGIPYIDTFE